MKYAISVCIAAFFVIFSLAYLEKRRHPQEKLSFASAFRNHVKFLSITTPVFILIAPSSVFLFERSGGSFETLCRWLVLLYTLYLAAWIDAGEHVIPNFLIVFLLLFRVAFLAYECYENMSEVTLALVPPLLGALIGGGIILAGMLVSRRGIGMGDVKMFFVIGLYVGSSIILPAMFCIFLISAAAGLLMLAARKATVHDSMPMAPFAAAGTFACFLLTCLGT